MRDNISIIFAAIIAVFILIILPLFSLMSRQDSIAYNKVLTLTTEFVDNARTKGYITEKEYTNYLAQLSATGNTYKVEMEWHNKILIEDINNKDVFKEDANIYYNKYIINQLAGDPLEPLITDDGVITFNQDDEFYIKVYNTNITTASLLYNYFVRAKIPPKVINIGYGGRVLDSTGKKYSQIVSATTNSPYIKFGKVKNANGLENKTYYNEENGIYNMKYSIRYFDIKNAPDNELYLAFTLNNFEAIVDIDEDISLYNGDQPRVFDENNIDDLETIIKIKEAILNKLVLTGQIESYTKEITEFNINNGKVSGTIKISNIKLNPGIVKTISKIKIKEGLGYSKDRIMSAEVLTDDLTFGSLILAPSITDITLQAESTPLKYKGIVYLQNVQRIVNENGNVTSISDIIFTVRDKISGQELINGVDYTIIEENGSNTWWTSDTGGKTFKDGYFYISFKNSIFNSVNKREFVIEFRFKVTNEDEEPVSLTAIFNPITLEKQVSLKDITDVTCEATPSNSILQTGSKVSYKLTFTGIEFTEELANQYVTNYVSLIPRNNSLDGFNYNKTNIKLIGKNQITFDIELNLQNMSKGIQETVHLQYLYKKTDAQDYYEDDSTNHEIYTGDITYADIKNITVTAKTDTNNVLSHGDSIRYEITFEGITLNETFVNTYSSNIGLQMTLTSGINYTETINYSGNKLTYEIVLNLDNLDIGEQYVVALKYINSDGVAKIDSNKYTIMKIPRVPSGFTALGYQDTDGDAYNYSGYFRIKDNSTGRVYVWIEYTGTDNLTSVSYIDQSIKNNDGFYIATKPNDEAWVENAVNLCQNLYDRHSQISSCLTYRQLYTYISERNIWNVMDELLVDKWYNHKTNGYASYLHYDMYSTNDYDSLNDEYGKCKYLEMLYFK